jgi:hypothetical protein
MTNEKNIFDKLNARRYQKDKAIPVENIAFTIQNKTIGCLQSFVTLSGLPKQGKSLFITSAIASAFTGQAIFDMKLTFPENRDRLCYVDTESSDYDYYKVLERMKRQMNKTELPENFDSFLFREDSHTDILQMIELYLKQHPDCSILIIDGVLDLIADFNNVEQSFSLIQWLKKISKVHNLLICLILHLGKKEGNTLGHIGSYLDRKSQSVLKVEKNKQQRTIDLTAQFLRSADDIDTIAIAHNGFEWIQTKHTTETNQPIWTKDKIELINRVVKQPIEFKELIHDLSLVIGKSESTAKKILKEWINSGAIVKKGKFYQKK